ncbi:unnamed protein product [Victoria cruziana]
MGQDMGRTTNETEDIYLAKHQTDSPSADDSGSSGAPSGVVLKKGPWTAAEDAILIEYVKKHGEGNWNAVQKHSGLFRCGKSCRLRWANHLRPNLKKGAFTPEEERLIIELHARIGNKWARMAAQLPGRTDNEIKNYWNTRIKRRQRAGLPLYPSDMNLQTTNEGHQSQNVNEFGVFDTGHQGLLHAGGFEIPPVSFDSIKAAHENLPYAPSFPDVPVSNILGQGLGSSQGYNFLSPHTHRAKRPRDYDSSFPTPPSGTNCSFLYDPPFNQFQNDTFEKVQRPFSISFQSNPGANRSTTPAGCMMSGSHALPNGNFSASKPLNEVVKLELPSFQYPDTILNNLGTSILPLPTLETTVTYTQSPPMMPGQSDCSSPRNSGLLQALIHEAQTLSTSKNHSCESSTHSSAVPGETADRSTMNQYDAEWAELSDSFCQTPASIFSEYNPPASGSFMASSPVNDVPGTTKVEAVEQVSNPSTDANELGLDIHFTKPDELLMSDWFEQSSECVKEQSNVANTFATFLGEEFYNDYKQLETESSALNQSCALGSLPWNNMPAVCQMSEQP